MKLGGVTALEAARALVAAFGYNAAMVAVRASEPPTLVPGSPPRTIPTWRAADASMELDFDDASSASTPVAFVGGYRESAREPEPPKPSGLWVRFAAWLARG